MKQVDLSKDPFFRSLIYAVAGGGKTSLYGTILDVPEMLPALWIDAGGQVISLRRFQGHANWPKLKILGLEQLSDLSHIHTWLKKGQPADDAVMVQKNGCKPGYKSLIFDGISHIQQLSFARSTGSDRLGLGDQPPKPEWRDYGAVLEHMIKFALNVMQDLPMHVLITALEREDKEGENGPPTFKPGLRGQAAEYIPAYSNLMGRLVHKDRLEDNVKSQLKSQLDAKTYNVVFFKPTERRWAKDQYGIGTTYIIDPTMRELYDRVYTDKYKKGGD